jgi:hypothetical protein
MGLLWDRKMRANWTWFSLLHRNPFNNMLLNRIFALMHIKLFVDNMLIGFQKVKILYYQTLGCNSGLLLINMFLKWVQLGHHKFFFLFNDIALHLTYVTFPSTSKIDFSQSNFYIPSILKMLIQLIQPFPFFTINQIFFSLGLNQ